MFYGGKTRLLLPVALMLTGTLAAMHTGGLIGLYLLVGLGVGLLVQASRFCMLGAVSDLILLGKGSQARAVLLLLGLTIPGFAVIQGILDAGVHSPVGSLVPLGMGTALGGLMFGLGAVLAGGCVLSTLVRAGEGLASAWLALVGVVAGSTLGAWQLARPAGEALFLPVQVGWIPALLGELGMLALLWNILRWWERKYQGGLGD